MEMSSLLKILQVKNLTELFAKTVSLVLNPVVILIPLPFYLIYETSGNIYSAIFWTLISFIFIFIFFIFIAIGVRLKYFSDFDISKRKQRPVLYFFGIFLAFLYIISLYYLQAPRIIFIVAFALTFGLIVLQLINNYLKASGHVATITAFVTSMIIIHNKPYYVLGYAFVLLVVWSRIKLKRHTPLEATVGGFLGVILSIIVYIVGKQFI
jgi:membrane-associated phospholipid phosphatase